MKISQRNKVQKIKVYHFHNGSGGGVFSVIKNLLQFSKNPEIENHVIYTINKEEIPGFEIPQLEGATSQQVFYYSPNWNFYHTSRQLKKLLPNDKAILVAHNWLELGMASNLGLQNPVVQFVHGDYEYYYNLALKHSATIDRFLAVANNIKTKLISLMPEREGDIEYLRFPVPGAYDIKKDAPANRIIFIGRLTSDKGYDALPAIALALRGNNIEAEWHIVGADVDNLKNRVPWDKDISVIHYGSLENNKVKELLTDIDFILLPSAAEGMPVTLVEAMKAGVIPLVNDIEGGIRELVNDNETGYRIRDNTVCGYVERLAHLINNKEISKQIRNNCIEKANELFEPYLNTELIETAIKETRGIKREKKAFKAYGSRLDKEWMGNTLTFLLRKNFNTKRNA